MSRVTLRAENVSVRYGHATALQSVAVSAQAGVITGFIGPNGAGKSSLVRALYGSVPLASGSVEFEGQDVTSKRALERAKLGLAVVPQGRQLFPKLTVYENLQVIANLLKLDRAAVDAAMERFPILKTRAQQLAGVLSGGEQQMLAVTRALMREPSALLLDEVMTGLAPKIVEQLAEVFEDLRDDGVAVVIADPSVYVVELLVEVAFILIRGEVAGFEQGDTIVSAYQDAMGISSGAL